MAREVLFDEFHIGFYVPRGLAAAETNRIRRLLDGRRLQRELLRAVRAARRRHTALSGVRVVLTR